MVIMAMIKDDKVFAILRMYLYPSVVLDNRPAGSTLFLFLLGSSSVLSLSHLDTNSSDGILKMYPVFTLLPSKGIPNFFFFL